MLVRGARGRWHSWWWVFGALIALPAVVLAALGASAIRATEAERQARLREARRQIAGLADAALVTALDRAIADARRRAQTPGAAHSDTGGAGTYFEVDANGGVSFPADRLYVSPAADTSSAAASPTPTPEAQELVWLAGAAEAQGRGAEAIDAYTRLRSFPELREWADSRALFLAGDSAGIDPRLTTPSLAASDARAPSGIPLAIVVSGMNEGLPEPARRRFVPLLEATLQSLRGGRWWMSLEQRRAYDAELRRWLRAASGRDTGADGRVEALAAVAAALARTLRGPEGPASRAYAMETGTTRLLLVWDRPSPRTPVWSGVALPELSGTSMVSEALRPVVDGQPFDVALREGRNLLWGAATSAEPDQEFALMAVPGWTLTLVDRAPGPGGLQVLLDRATVVVPLLVLACGLLMTAWIVRRELALSQLQANFLAAVTHEFKSPITGIRLLMERMRSGRVESAGAVERYESAVAAELARLEGLVNRLLDAQALQSGHKRYVLQATDIVATVRDVVARMRPQADAKRIELAFRPAADLPSPILDAAAVAGAVRNLVDNAIKYSPEGSQVEVAITAHGDNVVIAVADEGIGVEAVEAPRLFDAFYRGRRGERANVHGTGLGLALVKATAEAHGGTAAVTSDGVRGSLFTITLPMAAEASAPPETV